MVFKETIVKYSQVIVGFCLVSTALWLYGATEKVSLPLVEETSGKWFILALGLVGYIFYMMLQAKRVEQVKITELEQKVQKQDTQIKSIRAVPQTSTQFNTHNPFEEMK